jgi:hypothetical protein
MSEDIVGVKGSFRLQIVEGDKIVGDSGWCSNQIGNEGFRNFLARALGGISGSSQVTHMALGSGGLINATDTALGGEVVKRAAITAATSSTSKAVLFTATFDSANSFVTNTQNISNIGLFATSSGGTIFAGNTFASSSCATNQSVNASYAISFS